MAIFRYTASADTTITNAYEANLVTRGTGSNMGYADALEVFSIYGQESGSNGQSQELSRILIKFPIETVAADRTAGKLPASGSVSFYLKMFNAETPFTLPQDFTLVVAPVSASWTEGTGLDMDNYQDLGQSNWGERSSSAAWDRVGADYHTASTLITNVQFPLGYENLETNISHLVEEWVSYIDTTPAPGVIKNYGLGVHLTASQEAYFSSSAGGGAEGAAADSGSIIQNVAGAFQSYYTKKFFARSTEFFYNRPIIEARWDSRVLDDRENFLYSSSLAPALDNLNNLHLYNYIRGRLVNIPAVGTGDLLVSFYSSSNGAPTGSQIKLSVGGGTAATGDLNTTASYVSAGIYSCSVALTAAATPLLAVHDVWHLDGVEYVTGSFYPELMPTYDFAPTFNRITSCTNLKKAYSVQDTARFRFFVRDRNWSPTVYVISTTNNPTDIIPSASYSIRRVTDNYLAVGYGTGSDLSTYLSYDKDGNYFDLDMGLLEPDYMYEIRLSYYNDSIGAWQEQQQAFKFRVEE
tara:strand:- start:4492 stop:6060 length:1569 start_codon:yes stop_codon:yes gene_type:complete